MRILSINKNTCLLRTEESSPNNVKGFVSQQMIAVGLGQVQDDALEYDCFNSLPRVKIDDLITLGQQ